ncbi:MAG: AarF/ABC1/UbiB kinase family protein [Candidatus Peregrinibacteria bacterium]
MNIFQSLSLIYELYFKKGLPDLDKIQSWGLLAVKIGQIHALRLDFLSPEKCQHLSTLYRKNTPISVEDINILIDKEGGDAFRENFSYINDKPLATASVGQVYRATLKNGEFVVVKFIKANFKEHFERDVNRIKKFFRIVLFLYPKLKKVGNPVGILEDVERYTLAELDMRNEIKGGEMLKNIAQEYSEKFDLSLLSFQKLYPNLTSENVMVSGFINAPSVDELLSQGLFTYQDMLNLFFIQGFYIFIAGKFHGDIHPGNVLYDGKQFFFVDTAFIGEVGDRIRKGLFFFFEALSHYDYPECAKWLNEMAEKRIEGKTFDDFTKDFIDLYQDYTGSTVSQVSLTQQMMLTIKLGVNAGMEFEQGIFSIIRSLMYLDGMVLKCNPNAVLVQDMRPFIDAYKSAV